MNTIYGNLKANFAMETAMYLRDRLQDEYEFHRRSHSCFAREDERVMLMEGAQVSGSRWYSRYLSLIGDGLIAAGSFIKGKGADARSTALFSIAR